MFRQAFQRTFGDTDLVTSGGGLDDVGQRERGDADAVVVEQASCGAQRGVVATGADLEDGERRIGVVDADALSALVGVLHHAASTGPCGVLVALPRVAQHLRGNG